jgi:mannose-6-phosphate isomerase
MPAIRLTTRAVAKPWGRRTLWPGFEAFAGGDEPIGEIWFTAENGEDPELLVKYLFTSEKLSIQVHPDDAQAQARGFARGKDEAWLILAAEPGSTIALGPKQPMSAQALRAAACDGRIVDLLDWRPVAAGDFIYSPAGTVHAIGAGLTLIEVQQNLDLTYRLYDYGRPRELHLEDGAAVSHLAPFEPLPAPADDGLLARGPKFVVERLAEGTHRRAFGDIAAWLVPVSGGGTAEGAAFTAGECWQLSGDASITIDPDADALLAYTGAARR